MHNTLVREWESSFLFTQTLGTLCMFFLMASQLLFNCTVVLQLHLVTCEGKEFKHGTFIAYLFKEFMSHLFNQTNAQGASQEKTTGDSQYQQIHLSIGHHSPLPLFMSLRLHKMSLYLKQNKTKKQTNSGTIASTIEFNRPYF